MHDREARQLAEIIYPIRVSSQQGQLLALRLESIFEEYNQERNRIGELQQKAAGEFGDTVNLADIPADDRRDLLRLKELRTQVQVIEARLYEKYLVNSIGDTTVMLRADKNRQDAINKRYDANRRRYEARIDALRKVAIRMVEANIATIKLKVPADILDDLNKV